MTLSFITFGQASDPLVSNCIMKTGADTKYLKDFRIDLGKAASPEELRYKVTISLWEHIKYRFTLCNSEDSKAMLILKVKDETDKVVASSFDLNTGKTNPFVDFLCPKSGIYKLNYDFWDGQQGSGIGVVSMVK